MGGASYVNIFYLLLKDKKIDDNARELAVNVVQIVYSLGVLFASFAVIGLEKTIYADK